MAGRSDLVAALEGRRVLVPGSTSNLGPGFDALGLALQIYLDVRVVRVIDADGGDLRFTFEDGPPPGDNAIAHTLHAGAAALGVPVPSLELRVGSGIPVQAGLGSSAAAIVAGLRLLQLFVPTSDRRLLELATALEGHPDNVSASLFGGFTVSAETPDGVACLAVPWPEDVQIVVATPEAALATVVARTVLPLQVGCRDAVFNVQHAALLVQALAARQFDAVRAALHDRLHQPYRAALVPGLARALEWRDPSLLGTFLSGAGPSIAALVLGDTAAIAERFRCLFEDELGLPCTIRSLAAHRPRALPCFVGNDITLVESTS